MESEHVESEQSANEEEDDVEDIPMVEEKPSNEIIRCRLMNNSFRNR